MPNTTAGKRISSLNRLKYGCEIDGFLPCKRYDCAWADTCREHPYTQRHGWPPYGDPCTLEVLEHEAFVESAHKTFGFGLEWLDSHEFDHLIERFSILRLRQRRAMTRLTAEGIITYIELSDGRRLHRESIASKRYMVTIQRELNFIYERLFTPPDEGTEGESRTRNARSPLPTVH